MPKITAILRKIAKIEGLVAVMFTFSFSTAFAAAVTADQCSSAFQTEMTKIMNYLDGANGYKEQAVDAIKKTADSKTGFIVINGEYYTAEAVEVAAEYVVDKLEAAMSYTIANHFNTTAATAHDSTDVALTSVVTTDGLAVSTALTAAGMEGYIRAEAAILNKIQAPITQKYVEEKLAAAKATLANYDNKTEVVAYGNLTAAEYVEKLVDDATKSIALIIKKTDAQQVDELYDLYFAAVTGFKAMLEAVPTLADQEIADDAASKTIDAAVKDYVAYGLSVVYPVYDATTMTATATADLTSVVTGKLNAFWKADKAVATKGTFFGVAVANYAKATRAEVVAINNAAYAAVNASADVVKAYADTVEDVLGLYADYQIVVEANDGYEKLGKLTEAKHDAYILLGYDLQYKHPLKGWETGWAASREFYIVTEPTDAEYDYVGNEAKFLTTLSTAMKVVSKYEAVVTAGENLKAEYEKGQKVYDDALVDAAVKEAKDFVYGDLKVGLATNAVDYIVEAANYIHENASGLANLKISHYELGAFEAAIEAAIEKMIKEDKVADNYGEAKVNAATSVSYGTDKTPAEDYVYLMETYANADAWDEIAVDAYNDLVEAQSYAEIETIMAEAKAAFAKLELAVDADKVDAAQDMYKKSLAAYAQLQKELLKDGDYDFDVANAVNGNGQFDETYQAGAALIDAAVTVDGVKAAYEAAQALFANIKTDAELDAAAKAINAQINALPNTDKITAADADAIKAVYEEYLAYTKTPGATNTDIALNAILKLKLEAALDAQAKAINTEADALEAKLAKVAGGSDAAMEAFIAMEAEASKLVAERTALDKFVATVKAAKNSAYSGYATFAGAVTAVNADFNTIAGFFADDYAIAGNPATFWEKEVVAVETALVKAGKVGATEEEMKAALEAYNKLTDRQKYTLDATVLPYVKIIEQKVGAATEAEKAAAIADIEGLKIKANSSAKKGSITVKWTVSEEVEGVKYQVYKSTKAQKGYKKAITTSKTSFKNTKNLKKGTRYFYKVRAIAEIDGVTYYSDWSNKANRIAK